MKLTVITTHPDSDETAQIRSEAEKAGISCSITGLDPAADLKPQVDELGEIVIWRTSRLRDDEQLKKLAILLQGRKVINYSVLKNPSVRNKFTQQSLARKLVEAIPTFLFVGSGELRHAMDRGRFSFPVIQKPQIGSEGKDVKLHVRKDTLPLEDEEVKRSVFQPYIENDGDFRVQILGGKVLFCVKRIAAPGKYLNNVAQGGRVENLKDASIRGILGGIALTVHDALDLDFSGVDIIYDTPAGIYRFMEINVAPKWPAVFGAVTGVNVAKELVLYCCNIC